MVLHSSLGNALHIFFQSLFCSVHFYCALPLCQG